MTTSTPGSSVRATADGTSPIDSDALNGTSHSGMAAEGEAPADRPAKAAVTEEMIRVSVAQTSQLFGQAVWLFCQSPAHRHLLLADLDWRLLPPIALRQFRLFHQKGVPHGFVSWAQVDEVTEKLLQRPDFRLRPMDWKSGDRVWIVDVIAPGDTGAGLVETVREKALGGRNVNLRADLLPKTASSAKGAT